MTAGLVDAGEVVDVSLPAPDNGIWRKNAAFDGRYIGYRAREVLPIPTSVEHDGLAARVASSETDHQLVIDTDNDIVLGDRWPFSLSSEGKLQL